MRHETTLFGTLKREGSIFASIEDFGRQIGEGMQLIKPCFLLPLVSYLPHPSNHAFSSSLFFSPTLAVLIGSGNYVTSFFFFSHFPAFNGLYLHSMSN